VVNDRLASLVNLLTYLFGYRTRVAWQQTTVFHRCQWFGANMSFSKEDRILVKNVCVLKVMEPKTY